MSYGNTHTPTLQEVNPKGRKARYQVPVRVAEHPFTSKTGKKGVQRAEEFYLTPELEKEFRKRYPVTLNRDMIKLFGIGFVTMQRFKRALGLEKNMDVIRHKQAQIAKKICEENGYYDSIRGVPPSPQCMEASKKKRESGWHPLLSVKEKNPRRYKRIVKGWADNRKELLAKDRKRRKWGLNPLTRLTKCDEPYTKDQTSYRLNMRKKGYILGDPDDRYGERYTIYYDEHTVRRPVAEANARKHKITIMPLPKEHDTPFTLAYRNNEPLRNVFLQCLNVYKG